MTTSIRSLKVAYNQFLNPKLAISFPAIDDLNSLTFKVDMASVQTNILMVYLDKTKIVAKQFIDRLAKVLVTDPVQVEVRCGSRDSACVRFVTYWEISDEDTKAAIDKIVFVINEFENNKPNCL